MPRKGPNLKAYSIDLCYLCQSCLNCNTNYRSCKCKNKGKIPLNRKGQKRKFYAQTYQPNTSKKSFNSSQICELKQINDYYGYNINFSEAFDFSTCTKCHTKFWRLGKQNVMQNESEELEVDTDKSSPNAIELEETQINKDQDVSSYELEIISVNPSSTPEFNGNLIQDDQDDSQTPTFTSSEDEESIDSASETGFTEITFKLIIKSANGKCNAAKWETIIADNFQGFRNKLDMLVQEQFEDEIVFRGDYNVAYKQEKETGQGTQLTNNADWERFLKENERIISQKKVLTILIMMKKKPKKTGLR